MAFSTSIFTSPLLPITISIVSLVVTLVTAYVSNFERSKPSVLVASQISIYNLPFQAPEGIIWGGTGVLIPMTFFNWSPNGGSIVECRITIAKTGNSNQIFDMRWGEFSEMLQTERRMGYAGFAQPIALPPKSSITKTILFAWYFSNDKNLTIDQGQYALNVLAWTTSSPKPNIRQSFGFSISDEMAQAFAFFLKNQNPSTIDVSIREISRSNSVLTNIQAKQIYDL
jgi:hypothetical protein